jgi:hypothetical protein
VNSGNNLDQVVQVSNDSGGRYFALSPNSSIKECVIEGRRSAQLACEIKGAHGGRDSRDFYQVRALG